MQMISMKNGNCETYNHIKNARLSVNTGGRIPVDQTIGDAANMQMADGLKRYCLKSGAVSMQVLINS